MLKKIVIFSFFISFLVGSLTIANAETNMLNNQPNNDQKSINQNKVNTNQSNTSPPSNTVNDASGSNQITDTSDNNNSSPDFIANDSNNSDTVLSNKDVNNLDDLTKTDLLQKEIKGLNSELESLQQKLGDLKTENQQLKVDLQKYTSEEDEKNQYQQQLTQLVYDAKASRANLANDAPDDYIAAVNLLVVQNVDEAARKFQTIITNSKGNDQSVGLYTGNAAAKPSGTYAAYSNYWLGRISILNTNYTDAIKYFSESYKMLNSDQFALLSLVGLTESLTRSSKPEDACNTINQFINDYKDMQDKDPKFNLDGHYLSLMEKFKNINQCH
ncbi:hypothetical protein ACFX5K_05375 [Rickettsiales bacterium LUAb2]